MSSQKRRSRRRPRRPPPRAWARRRAGGSCTCSLDLFCLYFRMVKSVCTYLLPFVSESSQPTDTYFGVVFDEEIGARFPGRGVRREEKPIFRTSRGYGAPALCRTVFRDLLALSSYSSDECLCVTPPQHPRPLTVPNNTTTTPAGQKAAVAAREKKQKQKKQKKTRPPAEGMTPPPLLTPRSS